MPSDTLPYVETITQALRDKIIDGKDVNLALLLLPATELGELRQLDVVHEQVYLKPINVTDKRMKRNLTLIEFFVAFTKYKNVMCGAFPYRWAELDTYERDIVEMASRYGGYFMTTTKHFRPER